jgi:hypothetical protein
MKSIILFILFSAATLRAQVPRIDYLMADEAKSQLQIHGTFASDTTGFVTIENTKQTVRFWSDTLLICDLPDSGAGSGGHVTVTQTSGTSNARTLSIIMLYIDHPVYVFIGPGQGYEGVGIFNWYVNWRIDIGFYNNRDSIIFFEISKSSYGIGSRPYTERQNWEDTSDLKRSGISLSGKLNLVSMTISFNTVYFIFDSTFPQSVRTNTYQPLTIIIDSFGTVYGYRDSGTFDNAHWDNSLSGKILFAPALKNSVPQFSKASTDCIKVFSPFTSDNHLISLEAEVALGETTASLYSIDGRLLKQEKIFISSPGNYTFDANRFSTKFGILVLKTSNGVTAKKVFF